MRFGIVRLLALIALVLQISAPSIAVAAGPDRVDVSSFVCVTPGAVQSEVQGRMLERLADALDSGQDHPQTDDQSCSLCIIAGGLVLPAQFGEIEVQFVRVAQAFKVFDPGLIQSPRGPPVGATGPPPLQQI